MAYSIHWKPLADKQLDSVDDYLTFELQNPKAALDFLSLVHSKVALLAATGTKFRQGRILGTHEYVISPTTILVYRVVEKAKRIDILRLLPAAQNT